MLANLIELNKIEVKLSKKYYGGISPKFYLRDLTKETLIELSVCETCEDDICVKYYFKDVHIDLNHHYEMVDNYGLSAILQYVRLSELDDFDELFYYDGGWRSLGRQTADGYVLTYTNVPLRSLLLLRNVSARGDERIFTYEQGRQVWW